MVGAMLDTTNMACRPVQISVEESLLARVDADPETKSEGRSAFVRNALELYLEAKQRKATDQKIRAAYAGAADEMLDEVSDLMRGQAWPQR
jgi:metal-responsive CopG/Arc/MetJ family transcriptional regulator